jgi:hypothetical protein
MKKAGLFRARFYHWDEKLLMRIGLQVGVAQTETADLFLDSVGREESKTTENPYCKENHIVHAAPPQVKEPN